MKNYSILLFVAAIGIFSCSKSLPTYMVRNQARTYFAFFGRGSSWTYGITGTSDTVQWTASSGTLGTSTNIKKSGHTYESFRGTIGLLDNNLVVVNSEADRDTDFTQFSGDYFYLDIASGKDWITGTGNLPLENNVVVNGITYNNVLHLVNYRDTVNSNHFVNVWIAPNVGLIKMATWHNTKEYYLKNYKVLPML